MRPEPSREMNSQCGRRAAGPTEDGGEKAGELVGRPTSVVRGWKGEVGRMMTWEAADSAEWG